MSKFVIHCTWDEVPHLSDDVKEELWKSIPPYQRDARSKGVPQLGAGAVYPLPESDITIADFTIPPHFRHAYGLDVGWNLTAAIWGAKDLETGITYLYGEHYRSHAEPVVNAQAIQARGKWIPGVIDPASRGRGQRDGIRLIDQYRQLGLDLQTADHSVEAGVTAVWNLLSAGRLKVFKSCQKWFEEFRLYRRKGIESPEQQRGQIVKANDHLMDATRYLVMSGINRMKLPPAPGTEEPKPRYVDPGRPAVSWMN